MDAHSRSTDDAPDRGAPPGATPPSGGRSSTRPPRSGSRRTRPLLVTVGILVVALGAITVAVFLRHERLSFWLRYDRIDVRQQLNGEWVVGYRYVPRGDDGRQPYRHMRLWSERTGYLVYEANADADTNVHATRWDPTGRVVEQTVFEPEVRAEAKITPPWWWGVEDQTEPTSPFGVANEDGSGG